MAPTTRRCAGGKGTLWEGGVRVPCLVRWPGGGLPAGSVNDAFLSSLEILPSLAAAAGVPLPAGVVFDGFDWWATLRGEGPSPRGRLVWQRRDDVAARVGPWKWVRHAGGKGGGLFDLRDDPGEARDLSGTEPERLAELEAAFGEWRAAMDAAGPRGSFRDF